MKLSEDEILAALEAEETLSGSYVSHLVRERTENMDYYLGRPFGNEVDGRSEVIITDVADTIESIMPSLMRVFHSGDEVVKFSPFGPEDEAAAKQETDYVNFVVLQQNASFATFYAWFKDALINKNGYVKAWWDEKKDTTKETYQGLLDEEVAMIMEDPEVEPIEHTAYMDESGAQLHDMKLRRTNVYGKCMIVPVPADEILVSARHNSISLQDAPFVEHIRQITVSEIRQMGYEFEDDDGDIDNVMTTEALARQPYNQAWNHEPADPSMRLVTYREAYIRIDADGDGIAELRKICRVGKKVLENEEADNIPIYGITPILMSHQHIGMALADLVKDLQYIRSTLLRQALDNFYISNNGRHAISDKVNLDDMLDTRPGGIVRVSGDPAGNIMELTSQPVGREALNTIEFLEGIKESRTGVTRYNQGMDANSLNKTATGITQIMGAAQQRIELIARVFAETGVKDLFLGVHAMLLKHQKKPQNVQLNNKWVTINPRTWAKRTDIMVSVGLGTGNKDQMAQHLTNIIEKQAIAMQIGVATPKNIFNALSELTKTAGFRMPEMFFTEPEQNQQNPQDQQAQQQMQAEQQTQQQQMQMEQAKLQMAQQAAQAKAQLDSQIAQAKAQADMQIAQARLQADIQINQAKAQAEAELAHMKMQAEIELARDRMHLEMQLKASQPQPETAE